MSLEGYKTFRGLHYKASPGAENKLEGEENNDGPSFFFLP